MSAEGNTDAMTSQLDRLSKENARLTLRVKELESELALYEWKPLSPDALPQIGDLVLMKGCVAVMIKNFNRKWPYMQWYRNGWRWFAKLRLPVEVKESNSKMQ